MTLSQALPEDLGGEGRGKPRSHVISSSPPPSPSFNKLPACSKSWLQRANFRQERVTGAACGRQKQAAASCLRLLSPHPPKRQRKTAPPVALSPLPRAAISPAHPCPLPGELCGHFSRRHQNPNLRKGSRACGSLLPPARCSSQIFSLSSPGFAPRGSPKGVSTCRQPLLPLPALAPSPNAPVLLLCSSPRGGAG